MSAGYSKCCSIVDYLKSRLLNPRSVSILPRRPGPHSFRRSFHDRETVAEIERTVAPLAAVLSNRTGTTRAVPNAAIRRMNSPAVIDKLGHICPSVNSCPSLSARDTRRAGFEKCTRNRADAKFAGGRDRSRSLPAVNSTRHRDPATGPIGPAEAGMRCGRCGDALVNLGKPWDHPAGGEVDVQIHQLLGRGALTAGEAEHLVREVQALAVTPEDLRRDPPPLADQQLAFIEIVRLGDKGAVVGGVLISAANADGLEQRVGGVVEQRDVIGEVHMAVGVDPLRQYLAFVLVERRRDRHQAGRVAARIATG